MTKLEYFEIRKKILPLLKANSLKATLNLSLCSVFFIFTIYLAQSNSLILWVTSQLLLGVSILQFFFLFHDLGHQNFFKSKTANVIFGHITGLICALPYFPWHFIHSTHHEWTGWREKDPTLSRLKKEDLTDFQKKFINFCWTYHIPVFTSLFAVFNFWNFKKLKSLYPEKKDKLKNLFSLLFITSSYLLLIFIFGFKTFFLSYVPGLVVFLVLSDPLLISQHAGIRQESIENTTNLKPLPYYRQEEFTRSLNFPKFINNYILFGFNQHSIHHLFPKVPCYNLINIKAKTSINFNGFKWIRDTKKIKATDFMFEVNNDYKIASLDINTFNAEI